MKKSVLISAITIFLIIHCCPIFAADSHRFDYYVSAAPLSVHFAESKSRKATGYGFEVKNGFEIPAFGHSNILLGAELSAGICSFDTYKHFDYSDVIVLGRVGYRFSLNDRWSVCSSVKGGLFIGNLDRKTNCFGTVGGDVSIDYRFSESEKLFLSESVVYVFQNNAHSVLLNTGIGLKFAISGKEKI